MGISKISVLAKKELADCINDSGFIALLCVYTIIIFASSFMYGSIGSKSGIPIPVNISMISQFIPLIGIALGFNAVMRERKSSSLNVLLTHPVFRDNIIAGKFLGSMFVLFLITIFSVLMSFAALLLFYGVNVEYTMLERLVFFILITFIYASIFLAIGIFFSIITESATDSLVCSIAFWLLICITFGSIIKAFTLLISGQMVTENPFAMQFLNLSPLHHYAKITCNALDFSFGGIRSDSVGGIFDLSLTLTQCLIQYLSNIIVLVLTPVILYISCLIAFLRKDITL